MDNTVIVITDGCTGFPDQIGQRDLTQCCAVHDLGGSDALLQQCLTEIDPTTGWWVTLVVVGVFLMKMCRPIYNQFQKWGWFPRTPGSNF